MCTHDQEEALSLSDQVAILNHGRLIQLGAPAALYERPRTRFVADFLGKSNFLRGMVRDVQPGGIALQAGATRLLQAAAGAAPRRPAAPCCSRCGRRRSRCWPATTRRRMRSPLDVDLGSIFGAGFSLTVRTDDLGEIRVALPAWRAPIAPAEGMAVRLGWPADAAVPVLEDADAA